MTGFWQKLVAGTLTAPILLSAGILGANPCIDPIPLPPGFVHETLATFPETPVNLVKSLPDGRIVIGTGDGRAYLMALDGTLAATPFVDHETVPYVFNDQTVEYESEGGVLGCAPTRTFETDHYIYVFATTARTAPGGRKFKLERFQLEETGLNIVANSRTLIWEHVDENQGTDFHTGGGLAVGADGTIFFGLGDDGNVTFPNVVNSYRGKVIRIAPDGSAPTDNPFYTGAGGAQDYVYAMGLRNPYRNFFDTYYGDRHIVTDTGQALWEEVNVTFSGAHHGWTSIEGPISDNPGVTPPGNYADPLYPYPHGFGELDGIAIVGAAVCDSDQFPEEYRGDMFVTDWGYFGRPGKIYRVELDDNGMPENASVFHADDRFGFGDIDFDANGAIIYSKANFLSNPNNDTRGEVRRISYTTPDAAPTVSASANITEGPAPLTVQLSATISDNSGTPDFCWRLGDGFTTTVEDPQKTYGNPGVYNAIITAEDSFRSRASQTITISVYTERDISISGQLFDASNAIPIELQGEIDLFQPDGVTPLNVAERGILSTNADGTFTGNWDDVKVYGSSILARFEAPGFVSKLITIPVSGGEVNFSGDVYLSTLALTGTVRRISGETVAGNDVFVQSVSGETLTPYHIEGGMDYQSPLPETGVEHGVLTNGIGQYYLPLRAIDSNREFSVSANVQPNLAGYLAGNATVTAGASGAVDTDLYLQEIAGLADCDDVFPPSPLFPVYSEIQTIFSSNCIGCHGLVSPYADLSLADGFSYSSIVNQNSSENPSRLLIDTISSADSVVSSWLVEKVRCSKPAIGSLMPPTGKLSGREINLIGEWARRGAPYETIDVNMYSSEAAVNSPALVHFRAGGSGPNQPWTFSWDFDNGFTASGAAAEQLFVVLEGQTQFIVSVTADDDSRSTVDTISTPIMVTAPAIDPKNSNPRARMENIEPIDPGQTIVFDAGPSTDADGTIVAYLWDVDANGTYEAVTSTPSFSWTFNEMGIALVELTVVDNENAWGRTSRQVFVGVTPDNAEAWFVY